MFGHVRFNMRLQAPCWLMLLLVQVTYTQNGYFEEEAAAPRAAADGAWAVAAERRHWHAAARACARAGAAGGGGGGALAVPRSREDARAMAQLLERAHPGAPWAYVGLSDLAEEGHFATEQGEPLWSVGFGRWHSWDWAGGERDNCVVIDRFGTYWDVPCNWYLPYVCRRPSPPPPPPPPPPTCAPVLEGESADADTSAPPDVPAPQDPVAGSYSLEGEARNWWAAAGACARAGRRLALPRSRYEAAALRDLLTAATPPGHEMEPRWAHAFVGVSDLARAGRMRTVLGDTFHDNPEPSVNLEEDNTIDAPIPTPSSEEDEEDDPEDAVGGSSCLTVNRLGLYETVSCAAPLPFFCEEPPPPPTTPAPAPACPTPAPPTPDPDLLAPPPNHFWLERRFGERANWTHAARKCLLGRGVLAIPETTGEALAMADLLRSGPRPDDRDIGSDIWAYVGAADFDDSGNFSTIFGTPLAWERWGPGQPNGDPGEQPCLVLDRAATLWDLPCDRPMAFFCRRFPADPPWAVPSPPGRPGRGWRVSSPEMRSWLRAMERAARPRGFERADLRAWVESFRNATPLAAYAPFDFAADAYALHPPAPAPDATRTHPRGGR